MTMYQFHWWPTDADRSASDSFRLSAESAIRGAALALRHFRQVGCDIHAPLAHLDLIEPDGRQHTLLVEEVLDWLNDPQQTAFVHHECLEGLLS